MFVSDQFVYLEMQKTGSSHIVRVLEDATSGHKLGLHNPWIGDLGGRTVVGSVRNPWAWYVSLWAYGSAGKGALYADLTFRNKHRQTLATLKKGITKPAVVADALRDWLISKNPKQEMWRSLYGDTNDIDLFRRWLDRVLSKNGKRELPDGYGSSSIQKVCGLMTYRFLKLYTAHDRWRSARRRIANYDRLLAYWQESSILDRTIFTETLNEDLREFLKEVRITPGLPDLKSLERTNPSQHRRWQDYYDTKSCALVQREERFIIDQFNYEPPLV